jgi:hypothetical protein
VQHRDQGERISRGDYINEDSRQHNELSRHCRELRIREDGPVSCHAQAWATVYPATPRGRDQVNEFNLIGSPRVGRTCIGRATQSGLRPCTDHRSYVFMEYIDM